MTFSYFYISIPNFYFNQKRKKVQSLFTFSRPSLSNRMSIELFRFINRQTRQLRILSFGRRDNIGFYEKKKSFNYHHILNFNQTFEKNTEILT